MLLNEITEVNVNAVEENDVNAGEVKATAKKATRSDISKLAISKRLEHLARMCAKGALKIRNKKNKLLLNSVAAHVLFNMETKRIFSALFYKSALFFYFV